MLGKTTNAKYNSCYLKKKSIISQEALSFLQMVLDSFGQFARYGTKIVADAFKGT